MCKTSEKVVQFLFNQLGLIIFTMCRKTSVCFIVVNKQLFIQNPFALNPQPKSLNFNLLNIGFYTVSTEPITTTNLYRKAQA